MVEPGSFFYERAISCGIRADDVSFADFIRTSDQFRYLFDYLSDLKQQNHSASLHYCHPGKRLQSINRPYG